MRDITARKQAEKAVSESEARFRSLFDQANDAIFLTQGPTIVDCNLATAKIFGAQPEQIIGQTPLTFSPEIQPDGQNSEEKAIALINLALAGQPQSFQWKHKQLDGTPFDAEISLNRVEIGQEFYVQAFIRDISERKQAEIKLQQEQALSEAIINGLPGVFYLFDPQGKMFRWNKQYEQMMGFTPEEAAATNAIDAFPDEEKEHVMTAIQRVFVEGQATVETNFLTKHGKRIPHYLTGLVLQVGDQVYLAGTGIDITERKRLEAQVQEAYERRGLQVQLSTQVSQSIASASSLEELYDRVVTQVKEQFGYYHTQLLRYDPAQDAVVLVTGYGETGVKMLAAGHRLPMGEGLIGTAAASGETVLRPALENDPDWHANPLLPETKGEIAVPIKLGNTVLGVLDVQSNAAGALDADDQLLLEGLCGQIAVAVESTRLAQEMSERLEEINRLYRAMSQEGWKAYRGSAELPEGFIYDQKGLRPIETSGLADELFANVPLTVPGGETIGTLAIAEDPQRLLSAEDEVFLQQVSEQVALALESARLFEQTQEALNWQQAINHTSILIGQAKGLPDITRATAELLPLLGMMSCSINVIRETNANGAPTLSDIHIARFVDNEFVSMPPILGQPSEGWLPTDMAYYQKNRVTVFPNLDDISTMVPYDAYQAPGAIAYMRKVGMHSAITLALGVQSRPIGYLTFNSREPLAHIPEKYITWLGTIVDLISTSIDGQLLLTETEQGRQTLARRAAELETVATVSTTASTVLDPDKLLQAVVDLTKERFDLYHTHIYTYDAAWNTLLLAAGAGEVGRKLVAEEHAIPLTLEQSLVARAARERKPVIVNDVRSEPGFLPNPLLPETRAEMAVPMTVGDTLLGVFDVQSNNPTGFTDEDAMIYVTLAAQVGVALQNARSYVEQAALVTQLRELDKLKSSFLANMSHELRTPLNSILGFADVILEELDGPLTENMGNDLRLIQKNGQHLLHLINDVLDMAKIEAGRMNLNPERFTAFEVLDEVTSITSTLASEKNLALFIDPESDQNVKIFADRTRLRQVMINLVNNAIKFTENGKISLKLVSLEGARILITVKDTGIGIPPDKLDAVFQEFTQVDSSTTRKAGGTGLGLPISRRLVEMHGGRLWAESTGISGEGSTFYVELSVEARITETVEKQA
jgi:PAS domain S-box-containing protein